MVYEKIISVYISCSFMEETVSSKTSVLGWQSRLVYLAACETFSSSERVDFFLLYHGIEYFYTNVIVGHFALLLCD